MEPAATEIDWKSGLVNDGPRAAAEARARFDNETFYTRAAQSSGGSDSGRTSADDYCLDVIVCHLRESSLGT